MGLIRFLSGLLGIGGGSNRVAETVEIFRENAEKGAVREHDAYVAALNQLAAEAAAPGWFGRFVDGLNRLPRPAIAFSTLGLFAYAMTYPEEFAIRITGLALIPEPMWYLLGGIIGFYFGARELHKQRRVKVASSMQALAEWRREVDPERPDTAAAESDDPAAIDANPALDLARGKIGG
ncbi:holin family protein [Roseovarius sp. C03]|uniref:holin family protein n=1 Tax=Roseovarius sp. C03 TaxID=3449222 RepID=UPI003EDBE08F